MPRSEPLVSCVMVSNGDPERLPFLESSVRSFSKQTYLNRELIIVLDSPSTVRFQNVVKVVSGFRNERIKIFVSRKKRTLGEIRNTSLKHAAGEVICQWDDDDLSHPSRIEIQLRHMLSTKAGAVFLSDIFHVFLRQKRCYWINFDYEFIRALPGTVMFRKNLSSLYASRDKHEDTQFMESLRRKCRVEILKAPPFLYVYIFHGKNTFNFKHHSTIAKISAESREKFKGKKSFFLNGLKEAGLDIPGLRFVDKAGRPF